MVIGGVGLVDNSLLVNNSDLFGSSGNSRLVLMKMMIKILGSIVELNMLLVFNQYIGLRMFGMVVMVVFMMF